MDRKERIIKNLKRCAALGVFLLPMALYLILIKSRAGDALFYTAPLWVPVTVLSFAAGLFSYIILCRSAPSCEEEEEKDDLYVPEKMPETVSVPEMSAESLSEYPELFPEREEESSAAYDMSADISAAISAQKEEMAQTEEELFSDDAWREFAGEGEENGSENLDDIYGDIPAELPEGYETAEYGEEEIEYSGPVRVRKSTLGVSVLSKTACVAAAVMISLGAAFGASYSLIRENEDGFDGYLWEDVGEATVSQKLLGSLSVEVVTSDGRKTELFPAGLFRGEKSDAKYGSLYSYMAHAVREIKKAGAHVTVENKEEIVTAYKDAEDGSWEYISEIIGEKGTE